MSIQENTKNNKFVFNENLTEDIHKIISYIKEKNYPKYLESLNSLSSPDILFTELYKRIDEFDVSKRPGIIILLSKYSYQDSFARDRELNVAALGAELMQNI